MASTVTTARAFLQLGKRARGAVLGTRIVHDAPDRAAAVRERGGFAVCGRRISKSYHFRPDSNPANYTDVVTTLEARGALSSIVPTPPWEFGCHDLPVAR